MAKVLLLTPSRVTFCVSFCQSLDDVTPRVLISKIHFRLHPLLKEPVTPVTRVPGSIL